MDPITITILAVLAGAIPFSGIAIADKKVRREREERNKAYDEAFKAQQLALEIKKAQDAALTLEDKIWLFDMGRTDWKPEKEVGFTPEFGGSNTCIYYSARPSLGAAAKAYMWDLPDWYVDFLTTRPFHSALAKHFYGLACAGKDVKAHIAQLKQEHLDRIAAKKKEDVEREQRRQEWLLKEEAEERLRRKKAQELKEEEARRKVEKRRKEAIELEEKRRKNLGLTGTYLDTIKKIYDTGNWAQVRRGERIIRYAPGSKNYEAVCEFQSLFGLPLTGYIDADTLLAIESDNPFEDCNQIEVNQHKAPVFELRRKIDAS